MIIINTTMINAVYLDQYTIIDESSMINDDLEIFPNPYAQVINHKSIVRILATEIIIVLHRSCSNYVL